MAVAKPSIKSKYNASKVSGGSSSSTKKSSGGSSGGSSLSGGSSGSGYYDPNKDYSKELQRTDLTSEQRSQLEAERQNKIDAVYGGKEPNMIGSDKTYSQMVSGSGGSSGGSTGGSGNTGIYGVPAIDKAADQGSAAIRNLPDMSRRTDLAGQYVTSGGYTVFYDENGYATQALKGAADYTPHQDQYVADGTYNGGTLWTDENILSGADQARIQTLRDQAKAGTITWDEASKQANAIRSGYGYTIDKSGNVTDLGALSRVEERRKEWGLPTGQAGGAASGQQGTSGISGMTGTGYQGTTGADYGNFEDYLAGMGYEDYSEQTKAAIQAAVNRAVNAYRTQIQQTEDDTDELARQAYVNKMLGQKNLSQQLAANGYAGGMADSQRIAAETSYQNELNDLERQRADTVKELEAAITDAQLSGDMQTAQELQSYLQQMQSQWQNYVLTRQQMDNTNYWNQVNLDNENYWRQQELDRSDSQYQQSIDRQDQSTAETRAMNLLSMGIMPDDATLTAAGISATEAAAIRGYYLSQLQAQNKTTAQPQSTPVVQTTTQQPETPAVDTSGLSQFGQLVLKNLQDSVAKNGSITSAQKSTLMSYMAGHQLTSDEVNIILDALNQ